MSKPRSIASDDYSPKEARQRFLKTLRGALKTPPHKLKDIPKKRARKARRH
jgi:hypothetical protein